jgi:hypothetical protein
MEDNMKQTYGRIIFLIGLTILIISQCHTQWIKSSGLDTVSVYSFDTLNGTMLAGGTGGVYLSSNRGVSWSNENSGFIWNIRLLATRGGNTIVGTTGTSCLFCLGTAFSSTDAGTHWLNDIPGGGRPTAFAQNDSFFFASVARNLDCLEGTGIYRSTDGISNWEQVIDWCDVYGVSVKSNNVYLLNEGLYHSSDNGRTWFLINNAMLDTIYYIFSMSIIGDALFLGTPNGLFRYSTSDSSCIHINSIVPTHANIYNFTSSDSSLIAVGDSGVYNSSDGGITWGAITDNLTTSLPVYSVFFYKHVLYAGTKSGVWYRPYYDSVHSVNVNVQHGWNLVSLPIRTSDPNKSAIFPNSISAAFSYEGNYVESDSMSVGTGYWVRFSADTVYQLGGNDVMIDTIQVINGWNMIGSISSPISISSIAANPPSMVTSGFFKFNNGYTLTDTIYPGVGYWIKVDTNGVLILNPLIPSSSVSRIHIRSTDEGPPLPPTLDNQNEGTLLPKVYALEQAFPSPFNPATTIEYSLPENSNVTLNVYNLIGQTVAVLQDGIQDAGYRQVSWNASSFASGIYFYRLEAISVTDPTKVFSQVRKMVLIK